MVFAVVFIGCLGCCQLLFCVYFRVIIVGWCGWLGWWCFCRFVLLIVVGGVAGLVLCCVVFVSVFLLVCYWYLVFVVGWLCF